ncbi:S49 family peptidase [Haloarcula onubensis]|uniref:S49 family peptidase n=1 Tax=Haloarcula onubensis TaxID=2950539 RepID=A0ABU2FN13_9EURY|nr:S49 family peptidase [Halomicroarcula sp. S3CR25-11]MDS0282138.1 S49 family peptidase [Halomicroarcula sp. S3CR25-11]
MNNPIDTYVATALQSYTVLAIVALLLGAAVAPYAVAVAESNQNHVVVVNIDEPITGASAQETVQELRELRQNDSVKAVVLSVNSPGGGAAASESMYVAVKRLSNEKPVYTSVGSTAASGAYYTAIPSDRIFVTPGSLVGSVGVRSTVPPSGLPSGVTTGPDKAGLMTQDEYYAAIESMQRSFVGSVMEERGENLTVPRETVAEATVFVGGRAVNTGYADELGTTEDAIAAAAEAAGVSNYQVSYRDPAEPQTLSLLASADSDAANSTVAVEQAPLKDDGVDRIRFLMLFGTIEDETHRYNATDQGGVRDE